MEIKDGGFYKKKGSVCRIYKDGGNLYVVLFYNKVDDIGVPLSMGMEIGGINCEGFYSYYYLSKDSSFFTEIEDLNDIPLIKAIYGS